VLCCPFNKLCACFTLNSWSGIFNYRLHQDTNSGSTRQYHHRPLAHVCKIRFLLGNLLTCSDSPPDLLLASFLEINCSVCNISSHHSPLICQGEQWGWRRDMTWQRSHNWQVPVSEWPFRMDGHLGAYCHFLPWVPLAKSGAKTSAKEIPAQKSQEAQAWKWKPDLEAWEVRAPGCASIDGVWYFLSSRLSAENWGTVGLDFLGEFHVCGNVHTLQASHWGSEGEASSILSFKCVRLGATVHTYNPRYLGGWDWEDFYSSPAQANSLRDPISRAKWAGGVHTMLRSACFVSTKSWVQTLSYQ
jgi:hypothetical protein